MRYTLLIALGLTIGCATPTQSKTNPQNEPTSDETIPREPVSVAEQPARGTLSPHRAPIVVSVLGPDHVSAGDVVELKVVVEHSMRGVPLVVNIEIPPGTELEEGQASEVVTPNDGPIERVLRVRVLQDIPRADLTVTVDARGKSYGVHAKGEYRFGRTARKLPEPPRSDRPTKIPGGNLGEPIPLGR